MVFSGLTEGFAVLLLVPLLQIVGIEVQEGTTGRIAALLSTAMGAVGLRPELVSVLGFYVLVVTVQALVHHWQSQANAMLEHRFTDQLRQRLYRSIVNARWLFLSHSRTSDFTHALTSELGRVAGATSQFLALVSQVVLAAVYVALAFRLSMVMTMVALGCGAILLLLLSPAMKVSRSLGEELSDASRDMFAAISEHMGAIKTAKSYGTERRSVELFSGISDRLRHTLNAAVRAFATVRLGLSIGSVLILSVLLYVAVRVLSLPTAEILLLILLFGRLVPRFSSIQQSLQYFIGSLPAFATVMNAIQRCEQAAESVSSNSHALELREEIRLQNLTFSYQPGSTQPTLTDVSMVIPARQTTALVGSSGAGKSTVADLVMGLMAPDSGQVCVDGLALDPLQVRAWREQIGYVPQDTFLFHDSIRANLLWARPGANESELWEVLRSASADRFVARLSEGLDTIVGDRGVRLSGGERQRLALARALLRKPSLLILDEATSALDSENERRIQQAIEALHGDITILIITHRLSAIRGADIIHVLENGRVVESGSWDTLTAEAGGRFHALWSEQVVHVSRSAGEPNPIEIAQSGKGSRAP
ncbi:MAG: ABC transporter ATP-binding protein/permease, partial [Chloroflexota bacterium]|nr:ABC transporter ATP-binding protein/permease [Chloroflexota bacterium]